jgi:hypothetical protein
VSDLTVRRIVVAVDGSGPAFAALREAASLAARMRAELDAVFVEDERWARVAELPVARVVAVRGAPLAPSTEAMDRERRALARRVERHVREAAEQSHAQFVFRVARGDVAEELLAAGVGADLFVLGRRGLVAAGPLGTTAARVALELALPVVLLGERETLSEPVLALEQGVPAERAIDAAAYIAGRDGQVVELVAIAESPEVRARLVHEAVAALRARGVRVRAFESTSLRSLVATLARRGGKPTLVVAPGGAISDAEALARFAASAPGPVVVA